MKEIELSCGKTTKVDDCMYPILAQYAWHDINGYAVRKTINCKGKRTSLGMHREILNCTDPNMDVDHIDGDRLNNCTANLRVCTRQQNTCNNRARKLSKSGYRGVYAHGSGWQARLNQKGKMLNIGTFKSAKEAALAYDKVVLAQNSVFAILNFTEE